MYIILEYSFGRVKKVHATSSDEKMREIVKRIDSGQTEVHITTNEDECRKLLP